MSGLSVKKRFEKHLRIGVRFDGAKFVLLDGSALPVLSKDAVADLVLAPESIVDVNVRAHFLGEVLVQILEEHSHILIGVSPTMVEDLKSDDLIRPDVFPIASDYWFVWVRLEADLKLQVRGDQEARLCPCVCAIPSLDKKAQSLNHAFTLISEAYETLRRSHSGNVFERVYAQVTAGKWQTLDEIRIEAIARMQADAKKIPSKPSELDGIFPGA